MKIGQNSDKNWTKLTSLLYVAMENILTSCLRMALLSQVVQRGSGIECLHCIDMTHPGLCSERINCAQSEICFTHKYTYSNIVNYDMGCQTKQVCNMAQSRPTIIGKRDSSWALIHPVGDVPVRSVCYECCNRDGCNSALCIPPTNKTTPPTTVSTTTFTSTESTTVMTTSTTTTTTTITPTIATTTSTTAASTTKTTTTTTAAATTTTDENICPNGYERFESSCYMIVYKSVHWDDAKSRCHQLGSAVHLVSINSQHEQNFLAKLLDDGNFPAAEIWIGGYMHPFFRRWTWDDGSKFEYTSWVSSYPINDKRRDRIT